jgi:hypothetical protein
LGNGNLLDVQVAALALTLVVVGVLLAFRAVTGKHLGRLWLVSAVETYPGEPELRHRAYTFVVGLGLLLLGVWVLLRAFVFRG